MVTIRRVGLFFLVGGGGSGSGSGSGGARYGNHRP